MNTLCIYHKIDIDGWLSAAIVKHYYDTHVKLYCSVCEQPLPDGHTGSTQCCGGMTISDNTIELLGYNYGDSIDIEDIKNNYDRVITVDVSLDILDMITLIDKLGHNFIYIDHHTAKINEVIEKTVEGSFEMHCNTADDFKDKKAACELAWEYYFPNEDLPNVVRRASDYDCFRLKAYDEDKQNVILTTQYGMRAYITDVESALAYIINRDDDKYNGHYSTLNLYQAGISIYEHLIVEANQTYTKTFDIELIEPAGNNNITKCFKCVNKERFNPINFGIDYHNDNYDGFACFSYDGNTWGFSIYNDNGEVDCAAIAKTFGGGGHKGASGFRVKDITEFINKHKIN